MLGNIPIANAADTDVTVQAWQCVELYLSLKEDVLLMVATLDHLEEDLICHCSRYATKKRNRKTGKQESFDHISP